MASNTIRRTMKSCMVDDVVGEVTISITRRARRVTLSVRPSGEVRLSFPPYISLKRATAFLQERREWVLSARERFKQRIAEGKSASQITPEQIEQMRAAAKATLPLRLAELAARHGLKYNKVTIRATRSKWGSCTATGNISLSLFLMMLPEHLRDYIILHELAHTIHHNHSAQFHALVNHLTGGRERELASELRKYSTR